ncbi:7735_t:CDS:2 [Paraglomus brasilianum]|uniref:7735_t:CDS:1 n=1 Tax=Paraglomus brasilianum TaxID=144538 RepID=A0A9N8ZCH1_9GLOM|nr:7735_t:CDS:2 [Paraglomus brasilianum]
MTIPPQIYCFTSKLSDSEMQTFTRDINSLFRIIAFFSLIPLATASIVDDSYTSYQDLYDAILTTLFPITFVVLLNVSGKPGSMKKKLLPLLDDILYNTVTWVIPLTVSFAYGDELAVKIFSIVNMCLHVVCAVAALIKWQQIGDANRSDDDDPGILDGSFILDECIMSSATQDRAKMLRVALLLSSGGMTTDISTLFQFSFSYSMTSEAILIPYQNIREKGIQLKGLSLSSRQSSSY